MIVASNSNFVFKQYLGKQELWCCLYGTVHTHYFKGIILKMNMLKIYNTVDVEIFVVI